MNDSRNTQLLCSALYTCFTLLMLSLWQDRWINVVTVAVGIYGSYKFWKLANDE